MQTDGYQCTSRRQCWIGGKYKNKWPTTKLKAVSLWKVGSVESAIPFVALEYLEILVSL